MMLPGPGLAKRLGLDIGVKNSSGSIRGTNLVNVMTTLTVGTTGIATYMDRETNKSAQCKGVVLPQSCITSGSTEMIYEKDNPSKNSRWCTAHSL